MTLLETENLVEGFGGLIATDDMNPTVKEDERVSIIGPNGVGESTLISLITRRLGPTSGDIRFKGESIVGLEPHQMVQHSVLKSLQTAPTFPDLAVRENAEIAVLATERDASGFEFLRHRDSLTSIHGAAHDTLNLVGLLDRVDAIATDLSYGGKRRPEIGIALTSESDLLLMNEPAADMSPEETESMVDLIEQVKCDRGLTFALVERDMEIAFSILDHIVVLGRGGIIAKGIPDEIRGNEAVQKACLGGVEL